MKFIVHDDWDDADLIEVFTDSSYSDPDESSKLFTFPDLVGLSNDELVEEFNIERLDGNEYEDLGTISSSKASDLLRQMAMFRMNEKNMKKQSYTSEEARDYTRQLLELMGKSTEYYSNVDSISNPHDNPGRVVLNEPMYCYYDSICLIAINKERFLFLEQYWNFQGE